MEKIISVLFFGAIFGIFPIIIFYGGIFTHYLSFYEIKEYFNPFFVHNVNLYMYGIFGAFSGLAFILNSNALRYLYLLITIFMCLTLIPSIGFYVGDRMLAKNAKITINGNMESVKIVYRDKTKIYYQSNRDKQINMVNIK